MRKPLEFLEVTTTFKVMTFQFRPLKPSPSKNSKLLKRPEIGPFFIPAHEMITVYDAASLNIKYCSNKLTKDDT